MGKAIKAAKEIAEKHEAAVQELRNKAGERPTSCSLRLRSWQQAPQ